MLRVVHEMKMYEKRIELEHLSGVLQNEQRNTLLWRETAKKQEDVISSQQQTIKALTDELLILRNAARIPTKSDSARSTDHLFEPDIVVSSHDPNRRQATIDEMRELQQELDRGLSELAGEVNISNVTPEALEEATVASEEEWRKQHRAATQSTEEV